jgi:hypothetical protein
MKVASAAILLGLLSINAWAQEAVADAPDSSVAASQAPASQVPAQPGSPPSPYTHAYEVRKDIHKYASYATLPLFAAEYALGESLPNEPGGSARGAHAAVGTALVGLFFVNTVTGGWNLWQSRHEKEHRTPRMIHGFLMIGANAGFVATAASAPSEHNRSTFDQDRTSHRNIAIASIGIGTAGYLLAVFGRH